MKRSNHILYLMLLSASLCILFSCNNGKKKPVDIGNSITKNNNQGSNLEIKQPTANEKWEYKTIDSSYIVFKSGYKFDTHLYNLSYIGQIQLPGIPYLIFSGRDCNECDANISIYIHQPDKPITVADGQNRYEYPGTLRDFESDTLYTTSRAFFGEVFKGIKGVVWYEHSLLEKGGYGDLIYLSKVNGDSKKDTGFDDNGSYLTQTLTLMKEGKCQEIKGMDLKTEP
ncbi:MAG TPA: hypothetical protein VK806_07085 [Bacteroidia bacterium]|jgi:hypothetical protein|nr:hypothetical protein [Bacteroidia bacterium]